MEIYIHFIFILYYFDHYRLLQTITKSRCLHTCFLRNSLFTGHRCHMPLYPNGFYFDLRRQTRTQMALF